MLLDEEQAKLKFYKELAKYKKDSEFMLKWDRRNGQLERIVSFIGFDKKGPKLYFKEGGNRVDIEAIGGYQAIISLTLYLNKR
jgi:hypothetical protein